MKKRLQSTVVGIIGKNIREAREARERRYVMMIGKRSREGEDMMMMLKMMTIRVQARMKKRVQMAIMKECDCSDQERNQEEE